MAFRPGLEVAGWSGYVSAVCILPLSLVESQWLVCGDKVALSCPGVRAWHPSPPLRLLGSLLSVLPQEDFPPQSSPRRSLQAPGPLYKPCAALLAPWVKSQPIAGTACFSRVLPASCALLAGPFRSSALGLLPLSLLSFPVLVTPAFPSHSDSYSDHGRDLPSSGEPLLRHSPPQTF